MKFYETILLTGAASLLFASVVHAATQPLPNTEIGTVYYAWNKHPVSLEPVPETQLVTFEARKPDGSYRYTGTPGGSAWWQEKGTPKSTSVFQYAFCFQPFIRATKSVYTLQDAAGAGLSEREALDLDRLFTNAYSSVVDTISAAAFGMSIWEIITENSGTYDILSGDFLARVATGTDYDPAFPAPSSASDVAAATALSNIWLTGLNSTTEFQATGGQEYHFMTVEGSQNFITVGDPTPAPVPLPASGLVLLASLGGLFAARRK